MRPWLLIIPCAVLALAAAAEKPIIDPIEPSRLEHVMRPYWGWGVKKVTREDGLLELLVFPGTAAEKTGVRSGDILVSVAGRKYPDRQALVQFVAMRTKEDARFEVVVLRGNRQITLATWVSFPKSDGIPIAEARKRIDEWDRKAQEEGKEP